jgi:hypothetical protein
VLGTDTVPGMLENTHTENYKQPAGSKITQYSINGNTWKFRNEGDTEGERAAREVVLQALNREEKIFVKGSGWHDLVDGKYKQRGPFELVPDNEGRGTDHVDYKETQKAPPTPLSPQDFIKQFGEGMQPVLVKGSGFGNTDKELIKALGLTTGGNVDNDNPPKWMIDMYGIENIVWDFTGGWTPTSAPK